MTGVDDVASAHESPTVKRMRLRYPGLCRICGASLGARTEAIYERATQTVRCLTCAADAPSAPEQPTTGTVEPTIDPGVAGASARREFERRKARREERVRARHPKLGGLMLAMSDEPQSTRAWSTGASGEERLGARLDSIASPNVRVLHDRRIPGSRANIDHIAVTASGVWVVDAKRYQGRPRLVVEGGILRPRVERLTVGSRDCSRLVDGVLKQVGLVRESLAGHCDVPIQAALCFVAADWPLIGGSFATRGVHVLWPKKLATRLAEPGVLTPETILRVQGDLATHFPPA